MKKENRANHQQSSKPIDTVLLTSTSPLPLQDRCTDTSRKNSDSTRSHCLLPSTTPAVQPTVEENVDMDSTNELILRRMEDVILVWYYKMTHIIDSYQSESTNIDPSLEERTGIPTYKFCATILLQIITEGKFEKLRPDITTPLWQHSLPPIDQLPCMTTTMKNSYFRHLSLCRHQTVNDNLQTNKIPPHMAQYVADCENSVKQWFGTTDSSTTCRNIAPISATKKSLDQNSKNDVDGAVLSPNPKSRTVEHNVLKPSAKVAAASSPVTVEAALATKQGLPVGDTKKNSTIHSSDDDTNLMEECFRSRRSIETSNLTDRQFRWCGIILNVYHAWKCPFNESTILAGRRCTIQSGCYAIKDLYQHICSKKCNSHDCKYGTLCADTKQAVHHYEHCKSGSCPICGPVLRHIPYMRQAIKEATDKSIREVELVENAQRSSMKNVVSVYKSTTKATQHLKQKTSQHTFSSSTSSSPFIPRTFGIWKRSDDSNDTIGQGPPKKRCSSSCSIH